MIMRALGLEAADGGVGAGKQGVVGIVIGAAAGLDAGVFRHAPPGAGGGLVRPFAERHHLAVRGGVALEGEEARLAAGQRLDARCIGIIRRAIDAGALAVAEHDEEHRPPP